jgi:hypothetical protein
VLRPQIEVKRGEADCRRNADAQHLSNQAAACLRTRDCAVERAGTAGAVFMDAGQIRLACCREAKNQNSRPGARDPEETPDLPSLMFRSADFRKQASFAGCSERQGNSSPVSPRVDRVSLRPNRPTCRPRCARAVSPGVVTSTVSLAKLPAQDTALVGHG